MTAGNYEKKEKLEKYILICQGRQLNLASNSFLSICIRSLNGARIYRSLKSRRHNTGVVIVMKIVSKYEYSRKTIFKQNNQYCYIFRHSVWVLVLSMFLNESFGLGLGQKQKKMNLQPIPRMGNCSIRVVYIRYKLFIVFLLWIW